MVFLFVLITPLYWPDLMDDFLKFRQILRSKTADQDGRHSEMIPQLLRRTDVKGDIFRLTIYPPSLFVISLIFSELRRGATPPPIPRSQKKTKKARSK